MTRRKFGKFLLGLAKWTLVLGIALTAIGASTILRIDAIVDADGRTRIVDSVQAGTADCILVLGAQVLPDKSVSLMLADRLDTALALYQAGVSQRILVSGDHGTPYYDEVNPMRDYLIARGVPAEAVFMDHAGFDTFDSLYRAREVFQVRSCVIVTQGFHLIRALFIARELGMDALGVDAALRSYGNATYYQVREVFARTKAFLDCRLLDSRPTYLGPILPISGDGNATIG